MPLPLLLALFLAFGLETAPRVPVTAPELGSRAAATVGIIVVIAAAAWGLGRWAVTKVAREGHSSVSLRRRFAWGARILGILTLAGYGVAIHRFDWPSVVRTVVGPGGLSVVEETLIVLPFLVMQLVTWWGLYPGEKALRPSLSSSQSASLGRHLVLRTRQSLGLVLPMLVLYSLGQDLARRQWPGWTSSAWAQPVEVVAMGLLVMVGSPLFVRLAWPTRPLPPGPLRDRLEALARRLGFRCTDILIWDTGQNMVNACVTGSLPWFRYVLLTDALIEYLDDYEITAVFGHEIGHIAHRHLLYFGLFFAGSLALLTILGETIDASLLTLSNRFLGQGHPYLETLLQAGVVLGAVGLYFLVVFGHVSRRFERQADVFGCQAVSCGQPDCPPHADVDRLPARRGVEGAICPVGIRIFASALLNVASLNGMEARSRSWRHGSIARRIAFLEGLEGRPDVLKRFQTGVSRLRLIMALGLVAAVVLALATDPAGFLHR